MEALEQEMRKRLISFMWILVVVTTVMDSAFFLYYTVARTLEEHVIIYLVKRVLLPLALSLLVYYFVRRYEYNENKTVEQKNSMCSFCLSTLIGIVTVSHAYYTPLWCGPALVLMISTVFHNRKLQRNLMIYSCGLLAVAAVFVCLEKPMELSFFIESFFVVIAINILSYAVGEMLLEHNQKVLGMTSDLQDTQVVYEEQIQYDMLTKVCSRRYLMERAAKVMKDCSPNHPVSIAIIDIDNFKRVNDTFGHENGDVVLNRLGSLLYPHISEAITIGRYGGEEFVFVFDKSDVKFAEKLVDDLRKEFGEQKYDFSDNKITFSGGFVSCFESMSFEKALEVADQGLYYAKEHGKNQIKVQDRIT